MTTLSSFEHAADDILLAETKRLAADERVATARLIAALAELDEVTVDNLELRCRAHNAYEADLFFGPFVARDARECYGISARSGPSWRSGPS